MEVMSSAHSETDGESEGVWSPEIEQAFQEALKLFPPCGRRKHILQEEGGGKMYGRNELIARYIEQKTGQRRTRKQVSSHIQVLSRREARARTGSRTDDTNSLSPASSINGPSSIGPASLGSDSASALILGNGNGNAVKMDTATNGFSANHNTATHNNHHHHNFGSLHHQHQHQQQLHRQHHPNHLTSQQHQQAASMHFGHHHHHHHHPHHLHLGQQQSQAMQQALGLNGAAALEASGNHANYHNHHHQHNQLHEHTHLYPSAAASALLQPCRGPWQDGPIRTHKIRLVEFSAFIERRQTGPANAGDLTLMMVDDGPVALPLASQASGASTIHHQPAATNTDSLLMTTAAATTRVNAPGAADFRRHSFVSIDYRQLAERSQAGKLEKIDIREIQDKFPDIGGAEGLFARSCAPDAFYLVKFWADLDYDADQFGMTKYEDQNSYFGFSSHFETLVPYKDITCSTKACSYGDQVVEKVEKIHGAYNSSTSTYTYAINRSPMCEFMIQFIRKLRQLPELPLMNRILENFTVLQIVTSEATSEMLLCLAYVFEIGSIKQTKGSHYHVYKLTKD